MSTAKLSRILLPIVAALLTACAASGPPLSLKDKGDRAFERGDWNSAIENYRLYLEGELGAADVWEAQFKMAKAYYESEDFPAAAVEFQIFQRNYPRSDSLEAAVYYEALCWYRQSPRYDRDSAPTVQAIQKLEDYLLDFPDGKYVAEARSKIAELKDKLARKSLSIARFYRRIGRLEAATLYYEKLLREQPESRFVDAALEEYEEVLRRQGRDADADQLARLRRSRRAAGGAAP